MDGWRKRMKKKMIECPIHGLSLHRCKRRNWKGAPGRPYATEYTEKCFKCILEGKYNKKTIDKKQKKKHISFK